MENLGYTVLMDLSVGLDRFYVRIVDTKVFWKEECSSKLRGFGLKAEGIDKMRFDDGKWVGRSHERVNAQLEYDSEGCGDVGVAYEALKKELWGKRYSHILTWADIDLKNGVGFLLNSTACVRKNCGLMELSGDLKNWF